MTTTSNTTDVSASKVAQKCGETLEECEVCFIVHEGCPKLAEDESELRNLGGHIGDGNYPDGCSDADVDADYMRKAGLQEGSSADRHVRDYRFCKGDVIIAHQGSSHHPHGMVGMILELMVCDECDQIRNTAAYLVDFGDNKQAFVLDCRCKSPLPIASIEGKEPEPDAYCPNCGDSRSHHWHGTGNAFGCGSCGFGQSI
jgi:hypothetical protein